MICPVCDRVFEVWPFQPALCPNRDCATNGGPNFAAILNRSPKDEPQGASILLSLSPRRTFDFSGPVSVTGSELRRIQGWLEQQFCVDDEKLLCKSILAGHVIPRPSEAERIKADAARERETWRIEEHRKTGQFPP